MSSASGDGMNVGGPRPDIAPVTPQHEQQPVTTSYVGHLVGAFESAGDFLTRMGTAIKQAFTNLTESIQNLPPRPGFFTTNRQQQPTSQINEPPSHAGHVVAQQPPMAAAVTTVADRIQPQEQPQAPLPQPTRLMAPKTSYEEPEWKTEIKDQLEKATKQEQINIICSLLNEGTHREKGDASLKLQFALDLYQSLDNNSPVKEAVYFYLSEHKPELKALIGVIESDIIIYHKIKDIQLLTSLNSLYKRL